MRTSLIVLWAGILGSINLATIGFSAETGRSDRHDLSAASGKADLPIEWAENNNVAWKIKIPGRGRSAPVVAGNRLFLTTVVTEKAARPFDEVRRWLVLCLDGGSGQILWQKVAAERTTSQGARPANSCAAETPVVDGERVYAYFGRVGLFSFDFSGEPVWSSNVGADGIPREWEAASSPAFRLRTAATKLDMCEVSNPFELPSSGKSLIFLPCLSKSAPPEASPAK